LYAALFKYLDWLRTGDLLVLGTIPSTTLVKDRSLYDSTGQVVRHAKLPFMGREFIGTVYTEDGWRNLFQMAGFEIQVEKFYSFTERQPYKDET
jgi:hypothetical protein